VDRAFLRIKTIREFTRTCTNDRHSALAARNKWSRLHDINLALHVRPFDILIATAEDALNTRSGFNQATNYVVSQHHPFAGDGNFLDSASVIECQQTVFRRSSQNLNGISAWAKYDLFGDALSFTYFDSEAALRTDVDRTTVLFVEGSVVIITPELSELIPS
jgi:hypothetical protein